MPRSPSAGNESGRRHRPDLVVPVPFTQLRPGGLWLPGRPAPATEPRQLRFLLVAIAYSDLYGEDPTWAEVSERLK